MADLMVDFVLLVHFPYWEITISEDWMLWSNEGEQRKRKGRQKSGGKDLKK